MRVVAWMMIAVGVCSAAAGILMYRKADVLTGEVFAYRRELQATLSSVKDNPGIVGALPKSVEWVKEASSRCVSETGLKAEVKVEDGRLTIRLGRTTHRDVTGLVGMLERAGVKIDRMCMTPDITSGTYESIEISIGSGAK
jgi:hypothetical protein